MQRAHLMNWLLKVAEGLVEVREGEPGSRFRKSVRYEQVWHDRLVGFLLTKVSIYFGFLLPLLLSLPGQRLQVASYSGRVVRTGSSVCPFDIISSAFIFPMYPTLSFWLWTHLTAHYDNCLMLKYDPVHTYFPWAFGPMRRHQYMLAYQRVIYSFEWSADSNRLRSWKCTDIAYEGVQSARNTEPPSVQPTCLNGWTNRLPSLGLKADLTC